jgi:hypothetical protein
MDWEGRALGIILAGGAVTWGACTGTPCGNANPDPCICGRPDESAAAAQRCNVYKACMAAGLTYTPGTQEPDGAPGPPSCKTYEATSTSPTNAADARRD